MATDKLSEELIQAYGRLTAHEFVLEVIFANWVASMPEDGAAAFIEAFRSDSLKIAAPDGASIEDDDAKQILEDGGFFVNQLLDKVVRRAASIRAIQTRR